MISERNQIAAQFKAEGEEEATKIRNTADKEKVIILSEANKTSEEVKAEGEKEYMKVLSEAYSGAERAEFYKFIRTLDAAKISMKGDKTIILPLESDLTKIFLGN